MPLRRLLSETVAFTELPPISPLLSQDAQSGTISVHALEDGLRPFAASAHHKYLTVKAFRFLLGFLHLHTFHSSVVLSH